MHLLTSNLSRTGGYGMLLLVLLALGMPAASADVTTYINEELMGAHNENTVTVESGQEIKIWIDLTDSHKENVSRLVVVGEYMDAARDLITGVASYDAPDDNDIPPDYDRYYVKWPGKEGANGYARDGAYIGMLQVTVRAQHDNGSLLGENIMFVNVVPAEKDGVSLSLPNFDGILEKLPYAIGGLLLVLVLGFGVKRLLDPEELVPQKKVEYDPLKESMMGTGHKVELPSTEDDDDDDDEYEDDDDIDDSIGADVPEEGLSETELLAQLTSGAELADSSEEDAEEDTGDDAAPPAAAAAPVRRKVKKKSVRKAKLRGRKVKRKAPSGKPPKPIGKPPAPKGAGFHCPKDSSALQHWPDSGYATDYYCQKCEEYVAPVEQHAGDRQVTCPNCDRKHAIPPETTKFICQCGRRIRLG